MEHKPSVTEEIDNLEEKWRLWFTTWKASATQQKGVAEARDSIRIITVVTADPGVFVFSHGESSSVDSLSPKHVNKAIFCRHSTRALLTLSAVVLRLFIMVRLFELVGANWC